MSERDDVLRDLRERARFLGSLTTIGVAPKLVPAPARSGMSKPSAPATHAKSAEPPRTFEGPPEEALRQIREWVGDCQRCKLAGGRKTIVFGQGNPQARLMFVGEAPGADEDEQGLAFVGRAGQLLTDIIEKGLRIPRPDVFIANVIKCLRYNTQVLLDNGSWERIGRLVAQRYSGQVMSVDPEGRLVPKRVIGWHRSPLGDRRVLKLSYASSRLRGGRRAVTWLTHDHPVLTRRGWVAAGDIREGDQVAIGHGLSRVAYETVTGSLLGDGTIPRASSHLQITHCRRQAEYLRLKASALSELRPVVYEGTATAKKAGDDLPTVSCRTRASRALRTLRNRFYVDRRKRVPEDLALTPRVVAVWFLDDGYTRVRSDSNALSEIASHSFAADEIERLVQRLAIDIGIRAYTRASSPGRIHFGSEASLRLSEQIAPFCPGSMRYKLHPQVRDRVPLDPRLYEAGQPETVYDDAVIEPVDFRGADKTFFCIDVEETHNFVTSGGVVHNCRPPGNRNPEPDEVLSCQPFLEAQIEAIRPRVIVALGKFAVQFLLKTAEPISRVRGRLGEFKGVTVMPTFHPAYLLRNPSAKKEVWEDVKVVRELLNE